MPPKQKQNADSRLEILKREIAELKDKYDAQKEKFVHHSQCIEAIDARMDSLDQRFDRMQETNERVGHHEASGKGTSGVG